MHMENNSMVDPFIQEVFWKAIIPLCSVVGLAIGAFFHYVVYPFCNEIIGLLKDLRAMVPKVESVLPRIEMHMAAQTDYAQKTSDTLAKWDSDSFTCKAPATAPMPAPPPPVVQTPPKKGNHG